MLFQSFYALRSEDGMIVNYKDVVSWIRSHSHLPEFGHSAFQVNLGFMATVGTDAAAHGYQAGMIALKIIGGTLPSEVPVEVEGYRSINVNKTRMEELGIQIPFNILSNAFVYEDTNK